MKKYQPILTEKQRAAIRSILDKVHTDRTSEEWHNAWSGVNALFNAPEYPVGRRVRCRQPGIVEPRGRIIAPVWHVENDNGGHIYVREGEFELLPEPEGADLTGKRVKIHDGVPKHSIGYIDERGNGGCRWMRPWGEIGTVLKFQNPPGQVGYPHSYQAIFESGTWGWFSRDEFDPID